MRFRIAALFFATVLLPACCMGQSSTQNVSKFTGVWRGQFDNLPGVDIVLTDEGGELHGAMLFYLHQRANANAPYTSTPGLPEPMFNLRIDGQTLYFQVSHRRAHPPGSLNDAPKDFQLKLTGPDQAGLTNESGGAPGLTMKRTDY
jgi:hypothetical protein